jgi:hypothetical protein
MITFDPQMITWSHMITFVGQRARASGSFGGGPGPLTHSVRPAGQPCTAALRRPLYLPSPIAASLHPLCRIKCFQFVVYVIMWTHCYHVGSMLSCGMNCYHVGLNIVYVIMWIIVYVIMWTNVIMFCFHVMLSCGSNVIMRVKFYPMDEMLSCDVIIGHDNTPPPHHFIFSENFTDSVKCYHVGSMLSCGVQCYHVGWNVIMCNELLSYGIKCYHVGSNVIVWGRMLSCGINVIIRGQILSCRIRCYHVGSNVIMWDQCYHVGSNVIMWDEMLSCGMNFYHVGWNVIMWGRMLSCGIKCYHAGSNVIIWGRVLSCGINVIM